MLRKTWKKEQTEFRYELSLNIYFWGILDFISNKKQNFVLCAKQNIFSPCIFWKVILHAVSYFLFKKKRKQQQGEKHKMYKMVTEECVIKSLSFSCLTIPYIKTYHSENFLLDSSLTTMGYETVFRYKIWYDALFMFSRKIL